MSVPILHQDFFLLVTLFRPDQFYTRTYFTSNLIMSVPILHQDLFY